MMFVEDTLLNLSFAKERKKVAGTIQKFERENEIQSIVGKLPHIPPTLDDIQILNNPT